MYRRSDTRRAREIPPAISGFVTPPSPGRARALARQLAVVLAGLASTARTAFAQSSVAPPNTENAGAADDPTAWIALLAVAAGFAVLAFIRHRRAADRWADASRRARTATPRPPAERDW